MNIRNYDDLISSPTLSNDQLSLRKLGLEALDIAIESVRPQKLIEDSVKIENWLLKMIYMTLIDTITSS